MAERAGSAGGASRGDRAAFEKAIAGHVPGLVRFLARRAEGVVLDRESASDLAQSVCREALERIATDRLRFRGEAELKQWLYKAALLKVSEKRRHYLAQRRDAGRDTQLSTEARSRADVLRSLVTPSRVA